MRAKPRPAHALSQYLLRRLAALTGSPEVAATPTTLTTTMGVGSASHVLDHVGVLAKKYVSMLVRMTGTNQRPRLAVGPGENVEVMYTSVLPLIGL